MAVSQIVMAPSPVRRTGTFDILRYQNDQVSFGSPTPPTTAKFAIDASAGAFDVAGSFDGGSVALGPLAANPPIILTQGQVYTKNVLGVAQLFYEASDGTINQLTPGSALVVTLQDAYDDGNTVAATAVRPIAFSNAVDSTDILTLDRTFSGGGAALSISMGATTTGDAILVNQTTGGSGNLVNLQNNAATKFSVTNGGAVTQTGKTATYDNVATAGWGVPAIYGSNRSTGQTAAVASVTTYTVGAADGSFDVSANVNVTASTTHSISVTVSYTDETSTARTLTLMLSDLDGVALTSITQVNGAGPYSAGPRRIRCLTGTTITVATSGIFTSVTYNVEATIEQVS